MNGQRDGEIGADDRSLAGLQIGQKRRCRSVDFAAGAFDNLAIPIIREPMHNECSHLAQNTLRYVAWALSRQTNVESVLPALFGDQLKCV